MVIVRTDKEFPMKRGSDKKGFYMNETLKTNLDLLTEAVDKNWDGVILVDGG